MKIQLLFTSALVILSLIPAAWAGEREPSKTRKANRSPAGAFSVGSRDLADPVNGSPLWQKRPQFFVPGKSSSGSAPELKVVQTQPLPDSRYGVAAQVQAVDLFRR